ncbi:MAG: hypothetical protein WAW71_12925, partial [Propioniciclava sp.]
AHVGSCVFPKDGSDKVVNWPQQQYTNGVTKNEATGHRYKRFVRALKRSENWLVSEQRMAPLASYLMECLVYNVPDHILAYGDLDKGSTPPSTTSRIGSGTTTTRWRNPTDSRGSFADTRTGRQPSAANWSSPHRACSGSEPADGCPTGHPGP